MDVAVQTAPDGHKELVSLLSSKSSALRTIRIKSCQLVRHPGFETSEQPDIEQELTLEVIRKLQLFDPARASKATFVARIVESKAISLIRERSAQKRRLRRKPLSLNDSVHDSSSRRVQRFQLLRESSLASHTGRTRRSAADLTQLRHDIAVVIKSLPQDLQLVAKHLMESSEYAASKTLKKSRRQIAQDKTRLRKLFEDAGLADYV
jgi:RNA polymerase sigma-70 factor (ECF subfamily)